MKKTFINFCISKKKFHSIFVTIFRVDLGINNAFTPVKKRFFPTAPSYLFSKFITNSCTRLSKIMYIKGVKAKDDLASIEGTSENSGVIPFGSINALYIETSAYGVHAKRNINMMAMLREMSFFSKRRRLFTIGFSFFIGSFKCLTFFFNFYKIRHYVILQQIRDISLTNLISLTLK